MAPLKNCAPSVELLNDLCSRFVLNVPEEDLQSFERILFLVEKAHWFYEDNVMEQDPSLKSLTLRDFTTLMFRSCDALSPYIERIDEIYNDFTKYKTRVPVCGAVILDEAYERCLIVKGWKSGASWSFPRGKKNKNEEDHSCAAREVLEETGCDISKQLKLDDFIEFTTGQQRVRLFIVTGIMEDTAFAPQTKNEISEISWHRIDDLLSAGKDTVSRTANGLKLYMVGPFMAQLMKWISEHKSFSSPKPESSSKGLCVWKVKNSSPGGATSPQVLVTTTMTDSKASSPIKDDEPGRSFRNFKFDMASILPLYFAAL